MPGTNPSSSRKNWSHSFYKSAKNGAKVSIEKWRIYRIVFDLSNARE